MSAPYSVAYGYGNGYRDFADLDDAIEFALTKRQATIHGDGYDCDLGPNGYYCCDDGLTDSEREKVEGVGL